MSTKNLKRAAEVYRDFTPENVVRSALVLSENPTQETFRAALTDLFRELGHEIPDDFLHFASDGEFSDFDLPSLRDPLWDLQQALAPGVRLHEVL